MATASLIGAVVAIGGAIVAVVWLPARAAGEETAKEADAATTTAPSGATPAAA
jgi:hypothetical protein